MKKVLAWHFIRADRKLGYDAKEMIVEPGYVYSIEDDQRPQLCKYGMHGSVSAFDALGYAPSEKVAICRVRIWGDVLHGDDKIVGRHREVLWVSDADAELRLFACWCVRQVWHLLTDERSRKAVEVAEQYARGYATDADLAAEAAAGAAARAARAAESAAARAAAGAAEAAARAAESAAARAAAWAAEAAARAAAWAAARDAAWAATRGVQREEFERRMLALNPKRRKRA